MGAIEQQLERHGSTDGTLMVTEARLQTAQRSPQERLRLVRLAAPEGRAGAVRAASEGRPGGVRGAPGTCPKGV